MHYSLKRATLWNISSFSYLVVASLLTTPGLIHNLGLHVFGQYLLAIGIITIASSVDLGLPRALILRFHQHQSDQGELFAVGRTLTILLTLVTGIFSLAAAYLLNLPSNIYLPIFLFILVGGLLSVYQSIPESKGRFGWVALRAMMVGTANTLGAWVLAFLGYGLAPILYLLVFLSVITLILFRLYAKARLLSYPIFHYNPQLAKSLVSFGLPNQGGKIVSQLQAQYAKFLFTSSPLSLSSFGVASNLLTKLVGGVTQLSSAFYPLASQSVGETHLKALYYRLQAALIGLGIVGIWSYHQFGLYLLTWWLQDASLVASIHPLLKLGSYSAAFLLLTPLASAVMDSHGSPGITSLFGLSAFIIEVTIALALLNSYGALAPMIGQLISLMILVPTFLYATERKLRSAGT